MSAAPAYPPAPRKLAWPAEITEPRLDWEARIRKLADAEYQRDQARFDAVRERDRADALEPDSELLATLGDVLDLDRAAVARIAQAQSSYFEEARQAIMDALERWDDDQRIEVSICCEAPVRWVEDWHRPTGTGESGTECGWQCSQCGSVEDETMPGRRAA